MEPGDNTKQDIQDILMDCMWEMEERETATVTTGLMLIKLYGGWCHSWLYEIPKENGN